MNSNMDIYTENHIYLSAPYFVMDEKKLYFSNRSFNALVIVDRETWNVESMVPFEGEALNAKELHWECHKQGNKIYFLPQGNRKLHVYDMESGKQKVYELEGNRPQSVSWYFHVWQNRMYLLPCGGELGLWSLDSDGQLSKEDWWEAQAGTTSQFVYGAIDEQRFFLLMCQTREFAITDLENRKIKTYQLPDERVYCVASYDGQDFWYTSYDNSDIVRWNPECGEKERYSFTVWDKCDAAGLPYSYIYAAEQEIFVVSGTKKELFLLDKEKRTLKQIFELTEWPPIYRSVDIWPVLTRIGDKLIWTFRNASGAAVIDLTTMEGKMYQDVIPVNEKVRDYFDSVLFQNAPLFFEDSDGWDLERFLYHCENSV